MLQFSLWHLFGCPAIFFTVTPCDECSFRVRLYATCSKHSIPTFNDLTNKEYCVLDLKLRKDARRRSPGACALDYESVIQVVIKVFIGYDEKTGTFVNGIFGEAEAFANACEEQSRFTLHSHIVVWIKNFNKVRELMFHDNDAIRKKAQDEIISYFTKVSQATLGDLTISQTNLDSNQTSTSCPNTALKAVCKQDIRDMRHHIHSQKLGGVVSVTPNEKRLTH